jgi:ribose transport system substrate-binding protein
MIAGLLIAISACATRSSDTHVPSANACPSSFDVPGRPRIGVSVQHCDPGFYPEMLQGMLDEVKQRRDYSIDIKDARRDDTTQVDQVKDFIHRSYRAIVLVPHNSYSDDLSAVTREAEKNHIPVFTSDIGLGDSSGVRGHIASNNRAGGRIAAALMCEAVRKQGSIAILTEDFPPVSSVTDRVSGFRSGLATLCPAVKIAITIDASGERQKAAATMEDALQWFRRVHSPARLRGIFAINDPTAQGAAEAIRAFGEKVALIGYDGGTDELDAIGHGRMYGAVVQYPECIGRATIDAIDKALKARSSVRAHLKIPPVAVASWRTAKRKCASY